MEQAISKAHLLCSVLLRFQSGQASRFSSLVSLKLGEAKISLTGKISESSALMLRRDALGGHICIFGCLTCTCLHCSLFMQQKLRIREGVKKEKGSAMNATEITRVVQQGLEETGARGECATREMAWRRPAGVKGSKKGALPGISSLYHFSYVFQEDDTFEGMRVWGHEGIGPGKWFSAEECGGMWEDDGLLTKDLTGELQEATSTLEPGHVARVRAEGQGARLIYSDDHRAENEASAAAQREVKLASKTSKAEQALLAREEALSESKVHVCEHCARMYCKKIDFNKHVAQCRESLEQQAALKVRIPLRPASEMAKDAVHSAASMGIGEGVESRGTVNRTLQFPHAWEFVKLAAPPPVIQGWARKNVGRTHTKFTEAQVDFLCSMFDAHLTGGHKVKESEAHSKMKEKFTELSTDAVYSKTLVLTAAQIKSWFSQEKARRSAVGKRLAAKRVIDRAATELAASVDLPDTQPTSLEGGEETGAGGAGGAGGVGGAGGAGVEGGTGGQGWEGVGGGSAENMEVAQAQEEGEGGGEAQMEMEGGDLVKGALYAVVREEWEEERGFEVWELEEKAGGWGRLDDKSMLSWIRGRKWVHDSTLLDAGQAREDADDLPDKPKGGGKLGRKGERRFAASEGRRWATFVNIQPAQHGHIWLKIHGEKIEKYGRRDRISFVFKSQKTIITRAYEALVKMNEEDE